MTPRVLYLAVLCACAGAASAQQQQQLQPAATIEVKASADSARRNDTANRQVITREEIARYGDASALDAMKRLPGVTVDGDSVRMRGLGNGYTQLLVDGQRPPAGFSLESLSPELIERIEIMRAATAEFSTQAIAGTINIVLRKVPRRDGLELKLAGAVAARQTDPSLSATWSAKDAAGSRTLTATLRHLELYPVYGYREELRQDGTLTDASDVRTDQQVHYTSLNLQPRLTWNLGAGNAIDWLTTLNLGRSRGGSDKVAETLLGRGQPYPLLDLTFGIDNQSLRSELGWTRRFESGARLESKAAIFGSVSDRWMFRLASDRAGRALLDRDFLTKVHEQGLTWTGKFAAAAQNGHAPTVGWDGGQSTMTSHDVQDDAPLPGISETDYDTHIDARIARLALFAQDEWDIGQQWSMYLGVRTEAMRIRIATGTDPAPHASTYRIASPIVQALWKIPGAQRRQLRLALTRTFRAPPLARIARGRFNTTDNTPIAPDYDGNPDLKPEVANGVDAGFEWYPAEGASLSLSASRRAITDLIRNRISLEGERYVSRATNSGRADVRTLELEAKLPARLLWHAAPKIVLRADLVRNWSRVDAVPGPDNRLENQPRWSTTLGADYSGTAWSTGTTLASVAGGWTRSAPEIRSGANARHALDAYLAWQLAPARNLRLSASNLLRTTERGTDVYVAGGSTLTGFNTRPTWTVWRVQYTSSFR